jgi:DNA-binding CsgD family transcriptional regulator
MRVDSAALGCMEAKPTQCDGAFVSAAELAEQPKRSPDHRRELPTQTFAVISHRPPRCERSTIAAVSGLPVDAREPPLEREHEQFELDALLDRTRAGEGGMVVVEGPAGIGKTRLLDSVHAGAHAGGLWVGRARGGSLEQDVAFGVVHQLLEPLLAAAGGGDDLFSGAAAGAGPVFGRSASAAGQDEGGPGAVLHGLYWLTVGVVERLGPTVLIFDDAHWFDGPSLRFVAYLANRVDELPIAAVVGTRPPEPGPEGELLARLLTYQELHRLRLAPLSRDAVGRLVQRTLDEAASTFCDAIADASSGNPFLVTELVRAALASGAEALNTSKLSAINIDETVLARIGRLPGEALRVARAVAVLGSEAHLRHVATLSGLSIEAAGTIADRLLRADILGAGRPMTFVHPLVASAVYGDLLPGERSALHRRAADALVAEETSPDRVASHLMAIEPAGDQATIDILVRAARSALAQGGTEIAVAQFRRALAEPPAPTRRLEVVLPLAVAESLLNDPGAIEHFGEAIDRIPDLRVQVKLATARAASMSMHGDSEAAVASLRAFDDRVAADRDMRNRLLAGINIAATIGPTPSRLVRDNMAELRAALGLDDDAPGEVLAIRAYVAGIGGESAVDVETFARRALDSIDPNDPMLPVWFHLPVAALTMIDRGDLSTEVLDRTLTPARQAGAPAQVSVMLFQRGINAYRAGDLDDAESDARAALDVCVEHRLRYILPAPLSVLVDVLRERDELEGAAALLAEHGYTSGDRQGVFDLLLIASRARLRGAQGRWEDAAEELAVGWQRSVTAGCGSPGFVAWEAGLAEALVMCGRVREAADHARHAIDEAVAIGIARPHGEALRALALAEPDADGAMLRGASGLFTALGARLEEARTAAAASYGVDQGGPTPTADVLTQGLWLAERCGATRLARQLRSDLKSHGVRAKVRPVAGPGALTASERRVAALAGAGRTNKEIAQELFVTVKTVETHMARTFQKLGISSRGELRLALPEPA